MSGSSQSNFASRLQALLLQDAHRLQVIEAAERIVSQAALADAMLAAGFLRNCVWDHLHGMAASPLNDVDLIYFDTARLEEQFDLEVEQALVGELPDVRWEVKNQARMWKSHADPPYTNSLDAMRYWPEQQTALGFCLDGSRRVVSPFDLAPLFAAEIRCGPFRPYSLMRERADRKKWMQRWPTLHMLRAEKLS
ncbi:MAG: nucleotidyltransferase family protein [Granulosicoccaceae bacterium]